ncbi:BON domain-containing protein [Massilia sp. TS11]|uniref:BON domain-containing protein n=1 Tax=Massilia sp. TS11 TaxID=2908003 RepID=UPI001EDC5957|nr:BON domain-containing protein [Massilia sp. TS11]MCG2582743.1 BON domain-containing protein [Massilia sp. TS11]
MIAFVLAGACVSALAAEQAANTYRAAMNKAADDYKVAKAKCDASSGHAKDLCVDQAKLERAQAEADAAGQYPNSDRTRQKARVNVADAQYKLARTRCADQSGDGKDSCLAEAKSTHTTAVAEAKTGRSTSTAQATTGGSGSGAGTASGNAAPGARTQGATTAGTVGGNTGTTTGSGATYGSTGGTGSERSTAGTSGGAGTTGTQGARTTAGTTTERSGTGTTADRSGTGTTAERDTGSLADRGRDATQRAGDTMSDSMITTRVKADMFREPNLKASDIHVETVQGVVMLSGFVNNKSEAERAVEVAKSVKGVQDVKSAIKVK